MLNLEINAIPLTKPNNKLDHRVIVKNAHVATKGYLRDNPWLTYAAAFVTALSVEYMVAKEMQLTNRMIAYGT